MHTLSAAASDIRKWPTRTSSGRVRCCILRSVSHAKPCMPAAHLASGSASIICCVDSWTHWQNVRVAVQHLQQCLASAELVDAAFATADAGISHRGEHCVDCNCSLADPTDVISQLCLAVSSLAHLMHIHAFAPCVMASHLPDADGDGVVSPFEAPAFFRPSGLPEHVLSKIWRLSAPQNVLRSPVIKSEIVDHRFIMQGQGCTMPTTVVQNMTNIGRLSASTAAAC